MSDKPRSVFDLLELEQKERNKRNFTKSTEYSLAIVSIFIYSLCRENRSWTIIMIKMTSKICLTF